MIDQMNPDGLGSGNESLLRLRAQKRELRDRYLRARRCLPEAERAKKSGDIWKHLSATPSFLSAGTVMVYIHFGYEVWTREGIKSMLLEGKRVIVPYCRQENRDLGLAEIRNLEGDVAPGTWGILEPLHGLRGRCSKGEVNLVLCPGVAFDPNGSRLGHGLSYYDNFLREIKGLRTIVGLAFECQIHSRPLPHASYDIPVDQVITENGARRAMPVTMPRLAAVPLS